MWNLVSGFWDVFCLSPLPYHTKGNEHKHHDHVKKSATLFVLWSVSNSRSQLVFAKLCNHTAHCCWSPILGDYALVRDHNPNHISSIF